MKNCIWGIFCLVLIVLAGCNPFTADLTDPINQQIIAEILLNSDSKPKVKFPVDFEVDEVYSDIIFSGAGIWELTDTESASGVKSLKTQLINDGEFVGFEFAKSITDNCLIVYNFKLSSSGAPEALNFFIDDVLKSSFTNYYDWTSMSVAVTPGTKTFKWIFSNVGSGTMALEYACVDDIYLKVSLPVISKTGSTVTMSCATSSAQIFYTTDGTVPTTASILYTGSFEAQPGQTITAKAFNTGMEASDTDKITLLGPGFVFAEDFESGEQPDGWTQTHVSTVAGWDFGDNLPLDWWSIPAHTSYAVANDDANDDDSSEDFLIMPGFDVSAILNNLSLTFDTFYTSEYGSVALIKVSTDSGVSWTTVYNVPTNAAWQTYTVDLAAYLGSASLLIAFHHDDVGNWADGFAVDNVVFTGD